MRYSLFLLLACFAAPGCDRGEAVPAIEKPTVRVIDGDTVVIDGETVRLVNIDAPEMAPKARCWGEAGLAERAKVALHNNLSASRHITIKRTGTDRYGRTLAHVLFGENTADKDVGDWMISRGLAVRWSGRRQDWCGPADFSGGSGLLLGAAFWSLRRTTPDNRRYSDPSPPS